MPEILTYYILKAINLYSTLLQALARNNAQMIEKKKISTCESINLIHLSGSNPNKIIIIAY